MSLCMLGSSVADMETPDASHPWSNRDVCGRYALITNNIRNDNPGCVAPAASPEEVRLFS